MLEVADARKERPLATGAQLDCTWILRDADPARADAALEAAVRGIELPAGNGRVYIGCEAAAMRCIHAHLLHQRCLDPATTVTPTHTASVLLFGALALLASQAVAATMLTSLLELCVALLVVGLGARLVWVRWRALDTGVETGPLGHQHPHPHSQPTGGTARPGGLIGLGVAGGALPCPEALAILLVAVGLGRIGLGLGLIVSFSAGLAAVLIALGVLLVRAQSRLKQLTCAGGAWQRRLPLASAVLMMLLGAGMLVNVYRGATLPGTAVLAVVAAFGLFASGYCLALLVSRYRKRVAQRQTGAQRAGEPGPAT